MLQGDLKEYLDSQVERFQKKAFIQNDPITIPHRYQRSQDIEITAFWTAVLAWGQRKTIINKSEELFSLMDNAPYDFIVNHQERDRKRFLNWKHRTFQPTDTLYFLEFLQYHFKRFDSLETSFTNFMSEDDPNIESALKGFHQYFFSLDHAPMRTRKHIATPLRKASCKRLNMFLRWMVRSADSGVDFGLWKNIRTDQLIIPLDVHVERLARKMGLLTRKQVDWLAAIEITENLKKFDPTDPVKYDFALFGLGVLEKNPL